MITDELNALIKEYDFKKDFLDNHTHSIIKELKDWCVKERENIKQNEKEILKFFLANKYLVNDMSYASYSDGRFHWYGRGLRVCGNDNMHDNRSYNFTNVCLQSSVGNRECKHYIKDLDNLANDNTTDIDYWVSVKNSLLNANDNIKEIVKKTKDIILTMIWKQDERKDEVLKAVKEMGLCKTVNIKISVVEC